MLPEVGSTIVPPGFRSPLASAAATIRNAMRSLTDPPGLKYSTFASTVAPGIPRDTDRSRTSGVFPTSPLSESYTCMLFLFMVDRRYRIPVRACGLPGHQSGT